MREIVYTANILHVWIYFLINACNNSYNLHDNPVHCLTCFSMYYYHFYFEWYLD